MGATILLMGHGSRDREGAVEFLELADAVRRATPSFQVEAGFLEFAGPVAPSIQEAFDACAVGGATQVLAVPVLLLEASHVRKDMPAQVAWAQQRHPRLDVRLAPHLGIHPLMIEIVEEKIAQTQRRLGPIAPGQTAVLLVGRGTSDPEANADFYKIGRLVWERNRYRWVECCFISMAEPNLGEGIERCVKLGARRVLLIPYFINTGILVKRIGEQATAARTRYPDIEFGVSDHFAAHPNLVKLLKDRASALLDGAQPEPKIDWGRAWRAPVMSHNHNGVADHLHVPQGR